MSETLYKIAISYLINSSEFKTYAYFETFDHLKFNLVLFLASIGQTAKIYIRDLRLTNKIVESSPPVYLYHVGWEPVSLTA